MINLDSNKSFPTSAFLRLGFRPFFFFSGVFSVISMLLWALVFQQELLPASHIGPNSWHAHEMVFAYCGAVIVGFLLTASRNWSGIQTIYDKPLLVLLIIWLMGRFLLFVGDQYIVYQAIVDTSFLVLATMSILHPILKSKLWMHLAVVSKVFFLSLAHIVYYLGILNFIDDGESYGLYLGFYLVLSLLLMMSRRLLPFFIERGLDLESELKNSKVVDILLLVLFLSFMVLDVFFNTIISNILSGLLFVMHSVRAFWWFDKGIWKKPLLWSIYLSYCFLILGFAINFLSLFVFIIPNIDIHAFAFGVGLMTLSMMARVSLGHTGRNVFEPPRGLNLMFILVSVGFLFRVVMPVLAVGYYVYWVFFAQVLWAISFSMFVWIYTPMFFQNRIDGKFG
jgi:uncharacterized protein involved in response to NO